MIPLATSTWLILKLQRWRMCLTLNLQLLLQRVKQMRYRKQKVRNFDLSDFQGRQARMFAHCYVRNVTATTRLVKGVPLEHLVAAGESDSRVGKCLAGGLADTSVILPSSKVFLMT